MSPTSEHSSLRRATPQSPCERLAERAHDTRLTLAPTAPRVTDKQYSRESTLVLSPEPQVNTQDAGVTPPGRGQRPKWTKRDDIKLLYAVTHYGNQWAQIERAINNGQLKFEVTRRKWQEALASRTRVIKHQRLM